MPNSRWVKADADNLHEYRQASRPVKEEAHHVHGSRRHGSRIICGCSQAKGRHRPADRDSQLGGEADTRREKSLVAYTIELLMVIDRLRGHGEDRRHRQAQQKRRENVSADEEGRRGLTEWQDNVDREGTGQS